MTQDVSEARSIADRWASDEQDPNFMPVTRPSDAQMAAKRVPREFLEDTGGKRQ